MHTRDALERIVYMDARHHLDMSSMTLRDRSRERKLETRSWYLAALRIQAGNSRLWSDREILRSDRLISIIDRDDHKISFMQKNLSGMYMEPFPPHMTSGTVDKIYEEIEKFFLIGYDLRS